LQFFYKYAIIKIRKTWEGNRFMPKKNRAQKQAQKEVNFIQNYGAMSKENMDVFSLLGKSKLYEDLTHMNLFDARSLIRVALRELDFNEQTTPAQLEQIPGLRIKTFEQLVDFIEDVNFRGKQNITIANESLEILTKEVLKRAYDIEAQMKSRQAAFTPRDFILLSQFNTIRKNNIDEHLLLTQQKVNRLGLKLAKNIEPNQFSSNMEPLYGWESVQSYAYNKTLIVPMKNFYTNEWLLDKSEQTFEGDHLFRINLKTRKIKVKNNYYSILEDRPVILNGKKLIVDNRNLSKTEEAVLMMYEINKGKLEEKGWLRDKTKKRMKKYFKQKGSVSKEYYNAYKNLKADKTSFFEYKEVINDVIATLATINYARIYMKGSTFEKVEQNLITQASQKIAQLPRLNSSWVMPYVAERVMELSIQNYQKSGLTTTEIKKLYQETGRDVTHLNSLEEIIFSKINPSFEFEKATGSEDAKEFSKQAGSYRAYSEEEINQMGLAKLLKKHEKEAKEQEKTSTQSSNKEQSFEFDETAQNSEDDVAESMMLAKANLREFLKRNLTLQGEFSNTLPIRKSKKCIEEYNNKQVDMEAVSDLIYTQIANDIDRKAQNYNQDLYKRKDGKYYLEGWRLFTDYFKTIDTPITRDTLFKHMINDAVKEVEKYKNNDNNYDR
jgi:arsenate reductase-like glutaredoxin family protein